MTNRWGYNVGTETHIRGPEELRDPTSHSPRWQPRERREDTLGEGTRRSMGPFLWATREIIGLGKPVYIEQLPVLEGIPPLLWEKLTESHLLRLSAPSLIPLQQVFLNASESHSREPPNSLPGSSPQSLPEIPHTALYPLTPYLQRSSRAPPRPGGQVDNPFPAFQSLLSF